MTLPELWIPFGAVETLVTIQAESLGTVIEPPPGAEPEARPSDQEILQGITSLFLCDAAPPTLDLVRELAQRISATEGVKVFAPAPKRIESAVPLIKGRVSTLPPPMSVDGQPVTFAHELSEPGGKLFVATGRPDPLFGIVDAKVQACLNWVANAHSEAAQERKEMEPSPFQKTSSYSMAEELAGQIRDGRYATVIPRGGKVRQIVVDAPFDAVKSGFFATEVQPTKGMIVGMGGTGYDDTFSSALRGVWGATNGLRKSGTLLLIAECSEGLGSPALEMLTTERLASDADRRKGKYVEGLEEIAYLNRLKEDFDVLLLSALPEVYAKSKLGLSTARSSGEAVGRLLNKVGRSARVNVLVRAPECRISSA